MSQVTDWPWVKFYSKGQAKKSLWLESEKSHTVTDEDVVGKLEPPDIELRGCRVYFKFKGDIIMFISKHSIYDFMPYGLLNAKYTFIYINHAYI